MSYKIAVLPGDGIGREVMGEATQVLQQAGKLHGFSVELEEGLVAARPSTLTANP
jgi:isocitrate/isopropylmalate dehydrogenase